MLCAALITISSHMPKGVLAEGGTRLAISGTGFLNAGSLTCKFGIKIVPATFQSSTLVKCVAPFLPPGEVSLHVSNNGLDWTAGGMPLQILLPVQVTEIFPPAGPESGRTRVNIYGSQFYYAGVPIRCKFGSDSVAVATLVNQSHLWCLSPELDGGARIADIHLSFDNQTFIPTLQVFRYDAVAHLIRLIPSTGPQFGGTAMTAVGASFQNSGHSACLFTSGIMSKQSPSVRWLSHSTIICFLPTLALGSYQVQVSSNSVDFNPGKLTFVVMALPAVTFLAPSAGSCQGNTLVRVQGFHLRGSGSAVCKFGDLLTPGTLDASSHVLCVSPAHEAGHVPLEISSNGQDFSTNKVSFVYSASPFVLDLMPRSGPVDGKSCLNVSGFNFDSNSSRRQASSDLSCMFDESVVAASLVSSTMLQCCSPPHREGSFSLRISTNGLDYTRSLAYFEYVRSPMIHRITPSVGPLAGGTVTTIIGSGFLGAATPSCRVDNALGKMTVLSFSEARCQVPPHGIEGTVPFEVSTNAVDFTTGALFQYSISVHVLSLSPSSGASGGGTIVNITLDRSLPSAEGVFCVFGTAASPVMSVDSFYLTCKAPILGVQTVSLAVEPAARLSGNTLPFQVYPREVVTGILPSTGDVTGSMLLTLQGVNFLPDHGQLSCRFAKRLVVPGEYVSSTAMHCVTPIHEAQLVTVEVANNGQQFSDKAAVFLFAPRAQVMSIAPTKGSVFGRTPVTVTGRHFLRGMLCDFGGLRVDAQVRSTSRASCDSPAHHNALVSVYVTNNKVELSTEGRSFQYVDPIGVLEVDH